MKHLKKSPQPRSVYFTTYNKDGEILRVVSCPSDHVELQKLRPNESMLMGRGDGDTQKVVDGRIIDKTSAEMKALKIKNPRLRFDTIE